MSKEEYAQLYYLLGKLKYSIGEFYDVKKLNNLNSEIQKIDAVLVSPILIDKGIYNWLNSEEVILNKKD